MKCVNDAIRIFLFGGAMVIASGWLLVNVPVVYAKEKAAISESESEDSDEEKSDEDEAASEEEEDQATKLRRRLENHLRNIESAENYNRFEQSVYMLTKLPAEKVVPRLIQGLKKFRDKPEVQVNFIYALGRVGHKAERSIPGLKALLRKDNTDIRCAALMALGRINQGRDNSLEDISRLLGSSNKQVSEAAHRALEVVNTYKSRKILRQYAAYLAQQKKEE